jgi:AcrR family transcriptional regulator
MPRIPRKKEEVDKVRDSILDKALEIISSEGYDNLTMRKLGDSLGCSAKTIYNYYCSKEEIYLRVLTRGFEKINDIVDQSLDGISDSFEKLRIMCHVYIKFGLDNVNYYNIMFNWDVPKYTNYIGTPLEVVAKLEKDTAMHYADLSENAISKILTKNGNISREEVSYHLIRMWSGLHGFVSMNNSHGFQEYYPNPICFEDRMIEAMLSELFNEK